MISLWEGEHMNHLHFKAEEEIEGERGDIGWLEVLIVNLDLDLQTS